MRWMDWIKSLNLYPTPKNTASAQWRWKLQPEPAMTGFVASTSHKCLGGGILGMGIIIIQPLFPASRIGSPASVGM